MAKWCVFMAAAICVTCFASSAKVGDKLAFASYYQSHMVLQQSPEAANVWGVGSMGEVVTLTMTGANVKKVYKTKVVQGFYPDVNTNAGVWKITLDPMAAGGPYAIQVEDETGGVAKIDDVMFGDVWFCSGQSNMAHPMTRVMNATEEIATADDYPDVRIMALHRVDGQTARTDVNKISLPWSVSSSAVLNGRSSGYVSAVCWMYGRYLQKRLKYPIGLIHSSWGGTQIGKWSSPEALATCNVQPNKVNSVIWNTMVHPFIPMTIKGAIWYQGESNSFRTPYQYACMFPKMIADWRSKFNKESGGQTDTGFPFGFVQLAGNSAPPRGDTDRGFAELRWHQTADYGLVPNRDMPNVFMSSAMDLPDVDSPYGSIHPRHKRDISDRLGLAAMGQVYGKDVDYKPLWPSTVFVGVKNGALNIIFDRMSRTLEVRNKNGIEICCSPNNQTICGEDPTARWIPTPIVHTTNTSAMIRYRDVCKDWVVAVRYAWKMTPCTFKDCALYAENNQLPVPPFFMRKVFNAPRSDGNQYNRFNINNRVLEKVKLPVYTYM